MSIRREGEPHFTARSRDFHCGYGPRSIRLSLDRKTVFVGPKERWIICKDGALWRCQGETPELRPLGDLWRENGFERPGYVYDIAVIRRDPDSGFDLGVYLSTDEGVFLLRRTAPDEAELTIDAIYLPGITDTCFTITHAAQADR